MGDAVVPVFGGLACVGLALIIVGAVRRSRLALLGGAAVLLALAGAWVLGPPGALLGAFALLFLLRR